MLEYLTPGLAQKLVLEPGDTKTTAPKMCPACSRRLNRWASWKIHVNDDSVKCPCGAWVDVYNMELGIMASSAKFLESSSVLSAWWYHSTTLINWYDEITKNDVDWVHIGTRRSARSRLTTEMYNLTYKMKISQDAVIAPEIFIDHNRWSDVQDHVDKSVNVVRYVNRWESVGSISLMVRPEVLHSVVVLAS